MPAMGTDHAEQMINALAIPALMEIRLGPLLIAPEELALSELLMDVSIVWFARHLKSNFFTGQQRG